VDICGCFLKRRPLLLLLPELEKGRHRQTVGQKPVRRKTWANYFLGDRRLGDKLGRYGVCKSEVIGKMRNVESKMRNPKMRKCLRNNG